MAASQDMNKGSHLPITMTYSLLLQAIMFSVLQRLFPRMVFLHLILQKSQLEGNWKKSGTRTGRPGKTIPLEKVLFSTVVKWR